MLHNWRQGKADTVNYTFKLNRNAFLFCLRLPRGGRDTHEYLEMSGGSTRIRMEVRQVEEKEKEHG